MKVVATAWVQQVDEAGKCWTAWFEYKTPSGHVEDRLEKPYRSAGRALDALVKWAEDRNVHLQISTVKLKVVRDSNISQLVSQAKPEASKRGLMHENHTRKR